MGKSEYFTELIKANQKRLGNLDDQFLNKIREAASQTVSVLGIPNKKVEIYKYTNLEDALAQGSQYHLAVEEPHYKIEDVFKCDVPNLDTHLVVLANGSFDQRFNKLEELPKGVTISSLKEAFKTNKAVVEAHFGKYSGQVDDGTVALNTALANDGVFVHVDANVQLEKPLQIVNLLLSKEDIMIQHRNLFVIEKGASANVVICDHTLSPANFITNSVTEVFLGANANFDLSRMQNEHNGSTQVTHTFVEQKRDSQMTSNTQTIQGGLVRNNYHVNLTEPGCDNKSYGLYLTDHKQHVDNYVSVNHLAPHCTSTQLFKGVLDDESTGAFNGRIYVERDAQKTMAYQTNRNLLLTNTTKMNTKPQLEIFADDVRCSHGATVGQMDPEALFYLQSRGINQKDAKLLLMNSFTSEITNEIKVDQLRARVENMVAKRLKGELIRCHDCALLSANPS